MNMKRVVFTLALCLGLGSLAHAQVPTLTNFGFETPNVGTPRYEAFQYNPTGAGWAFIDQAGVAGNNSGFTSGNPNAPQGNQVAFLQRSGSITQTFTLNNAVLNFGVNLLAAQRSTAVAQASVQTFTVFVDSTLLGTFTPTGITYANYATSTVNLAAGNHLLTISGTNPGGGDNTALIDNVQLTGVVVPEAGTATLLGAVLPLVGGVVVLRRKFRG